MKIPKQIFLIFILFLIVSCGSKSTDEEIQARSDNGQKTTSKLMGNQGNDGLGGKTSTFLIETQSIGDYDTSSVIEKVGTISSSETINVNSEVSGKLTGLYVKEGEKVVEGQILAVLEDSYNKYYLDLESAEISYQKTIISKESEIISLDKKISDAKINLEDALFDYENEKKTSTEDLIEAKLNYENSDLIDTNSQSFLELEKAKLDYENTVNSNIQQINTYISNVQKEYNNLVINLDDVIDFTDELLGVTDDNKNEDDDFEDYLGAKDKGSKNEAKITLRELIDYKKELLSISINSLNENSLIETMDSFYDGYENINTLLGEMEVVLNNSISSVGAITDSEIDSYISQTNSYQNSNQSNLSSFNTTKSSIISFLNTYKDEELSSLKNIELQEKQLEDSSITGETTYNKLVASIESNLYTFESKYNQAKLEYDNAIDNKEVSIKSLNNSIASAKNTRDKASLEYSKLTIKSPITGIISTVNSDKNTDISAGKQLFTVISDDKTQIEVSLTSSEVKNVSIGDPVKVYYLDNFYYGEVFSKSYVADENLEYNVTVLLEENLELIGGSTVVEFATTHENILLPLDYITIEGDNLGSVNYYSSGKLEEIEISLGNIEGNNIEILSPLPSDLEIVITDLSNYNSLTQTLEVNNK